MLSKLALSAVSLGLLAAGQQYNVVFNNYGGGNGGWGGDGDHKPPTPPVKPPMPESDTPSIDAITKRGYLLCGTGENMAIFSTGTGASRTGFNVALCQAVAAAIFPDYFASPADRLKFVTVDDVSRFQLIQTDAVDLVSYTSTKTQLREAKYNIRFAPITFYDGAGILARTADGANALTDLTTGTICVGTGTTTVDAITRFIQGKAGLSVKSDLTRTAAITEFAKAAGSSACTYYADDLSSLAGIATAGTNKVLTGAALSKEPLAAFTSQHDEDLGDLVESVVNALFLAEEQSVTKASVAAELYETEVAEELGVSPGFTIRAVKANGNYGEIYTTFAQPKIPRASSKNQQASNGGLIYAYN